MVGVPTSSSAAENPDQVLPMLAPHRLVGEIRLWRGRAPLPATNSILVQNFAEQGALAIERVQEDASLKPPATSAGNGTHN